jgi:hypothetical protein
LALVLFYLSYLPLDHLGQLSMFSSIALLKFNHNTLKKSS